MAFESGFFDRSARLEGWLLIRVNHALVEQVVGEGIKKIITNGCPTPEIFLCSPLVRAADTMKIAYSGLMDDKPAPVIMEVSHAGFPRLTSCLHTSDLRGGATQGLREIHGKATCDKRHSKV
jgi:hypothetical protein